MVRKLSILAAAAFFAATGCVYDDRTDCPVPLGTETVRLRVVDFTTGEDITSQAVTSGQIADATLFMFAADSTYIGRLDIPRDSIVNDISLTVGTRAQIAGPVRYVSAWGNIEGNIGCMEIPLGEHMTTRFLDLLSGDADTRKCPGEMFFGIEDLGVPEMRDTPRRTIDITQKNARLMITTRGLPSGDDEDYYYRLCNQNCGYDFDGVPDEDSVEIWEAGVFTPGGDYISPQPYYLIHSVDPQNVDHLTCANIHLYKVDETRAGDTQIAAVDRDSTGKLISLAQGMITNVLIDLSGTGDPRVEVVVTPWNQIHQWTQW